jgi:hypothetical protein
MWRRRAALPDLLLLLAILAVGCLPSPVWAESAEPGAGVRFGRGARHVGLTAGVGIAMQRIGEDRDTDDVRYVATTPRFGIGLFDPLGGDAWYRGNFELVLEGTFLAQFEPHGGWAGGGSTILRYNLLCCGRFVPFFDGGVGILNLDFDLEDQADGINFIIHAGLGTHYFLSERTALTGEWRYQHISNARINYPNRSINASAFFLGASFFLD